MQRSGPESRGTSFRGGSKSGGKAFEMDQRSRDKLREVTRKKGASLKSGLESEGDRLSILTSKKKSLLASQHIHFVYF
jgi:hypothetical protein